MKISRVLVKDFRNKNNNIDWQLNKDVNILAGNNGCGKSQLLSLIKIALSVEFEDIYPFKPPHLFDYNEPAKFGQLLCVCNGITIEFDNGSAVIVTFSTIQNKWIRHLYNIKTQDLNNLLNVCTTDLPELYLNNEYSQSIKQLFDNPQPLIDTINLFLCSSGDSGITFEYNELISFKDNKTNKRIPYQFLSTGQKNIVDMIMRIHVAKLNNPNNILLIDEPVNGLHIEWQKMLIDGFYKISPNSQFVITTHCPALIMNGWRKHVFNMHNILTLDM